MRPNLHPPYPTLVDSEEPRLRMAGTVYMKGAGLDLGDSLVSAGCDWFGVLECDTPQTVCCALRKDDAHKKPFQGHQPCTQNATRHETNKASTAVCDDGMMMTPTKPAKEHVMYTEPPEPQMRVPTMALLTPRSAWQYHMQVGPDFFISLLSRLPLYLSLDVCLTNVQTHKHTPHFPQATRPPTQLQETRHVAHISPTKSEKSKSRSAVICSPRRAVLTRQERRKLGIAPLYDTLDSTRADEEGMLM